MNNRFTFRIKKRLGTIRVNPTTNWTKELNLIEWNKTGKAKLDIRDWDETHEHMSRGITLSEAEGQVLMGLLQEYYKA